MSSLTSRVDHEERTLTLSTLASLAGFNKRLTRLPDGRIPDVLQIDLEGKALFIGDAKDTETPGNAETSVRLMAYLRWMKLHVSRKKNTLAVFALCVGNASHLSAWKNLLLYLCHEVGFGTVSIQERAFGHKRYALWFTIAANGAGAETETRIHSRASSRLALMRMRAGFN